MISSASPEAGFALLVLGGLFYLAPWLLALARGAGNVAGIFTLNLFLGWTLLGWVAALVWAVSDRTSSEAGVTRGRAATARPRSLNGGEPDGRALLRRAIQRDAAPAAVAATDIEDVAETPSTVRALTEEQEAIVRAKGNRAYPCAIAGLGHPGADGRLRGQVVATLPVGAVLRLRPEPDNPADPDAVGVWRGETHLGYVPRRAAWVAEAIDEGDNLAAVLARVETFADGAVRARMIILVLSDG